MPVFELKLSIPPAELDASYHHVSHDRSLKLFEMGRLALLERIGFPAPELLASGLMPVITSVSVQFEREVRAGDIVITCDSVTERGRRFFVMKQRIINELGKEAVSGDIGWTLMSRESKRAVIMPEPLRLALLKALE